MRTTGPAGRGGAGRVLATALFMWLAALPWPSAAAETAATLVSTEGTVYVQRAETGRNLIASPGTTLSPGDVLNTSRTSAAFVRFQDGSELAVRPGSRLQLEEYRFLRDRPSEDSMILRLLKGGLRQLSGLIGKRGNRAAYQLRTVTATIGVRGTDFTVRLCEDDCGGEDTLAAKPKKAEERPINNNPRSVSGRIVSIAGSVTAYEESTKTRRLSAGAPVYAGDTIETGGAGPTTLAFLDGTRVVIDRNSSFHVEAFRYSAERPEADNMVVQLLKGGMRMLTGLLGKRNPQKLGVRTVTATLGVRGTSFDLICASGDLADPRNPDPAQLDGAECNEAVYAYTRDGAVSLQSGEAPETVLAKGESGVVPGEGKAIEHLPAVPAAILQRDWPTPESLEIDMGTLFGADGSNADDAGLYVVVREGTIELKSTASGEVVAFAAGEAGRMSPAGDQIVRFSSTPRFLERDSFLADSIIGFGICRP